MNEILSAAATPRVTPSVTPLAAKAMLVRLQVTKPTTSRREQAAEAIIQQAMGDSSLTVSSHTFKDRSNPVRVVLNEAGAVYAFHTAHTMAWQDRGPRMLPVEQYDRYSTEMRRLIAEVDKSVADLEPIYDGLVAQDIEDRRNAAVQAGKTPRDASTFAADYLSYPDFKAKMKHEFMFMPMPDESHFLFDINEEDKAALKQQVVEAEAAAKAEVVERMRQPLVHLIEKLKKQIGETGAIFRDSAITNVVEQCETAEALAMGDESILALVAEVRKAIKPHALHPDGVRESPITRADAASKLAAVADRMSFLMGAPS